MHTYDVKNTRIRSHFSSRRSRKILALRCHRIACPRKMSSMSATRKKNDSALWSAAAGMDPSLLGECYECMASAPDSACMSLPPRIQHLSVCTSGSNANRLLTWAELSVCTDGEAMQIAKSPKLEYQTAQNNSASALWAAAAGMDASVLGECYDCMAFAPGSTCMPLPPQVRDISVCTSRSVANRLLTWDELSVCTDDEATQIVDSPILDDQVFSREIVALASTVLRATQHAEYPHTQSIVKQNALLNLRANLHGMVPRLLIITQYAKYAWTAELDDALKALYSKLRSYNRFMRPVYGYPSRQIKVFYAAGMRERTVCKEMSAQGMDQRLFLQACMPLRRHW